MKTTFFLSPHPGAGKTTVMINLGIALQQSGSSVLLANLKNDPIFNDWLKLPLQPLGMSKICTSHLGPDALISTRLPSFALLTGYEYIFIEGNPAGLAELFGTLRTYNVCCCFNTRQDSLHELITFRDNLAAHYHDVDLFIPCQTPPGEWNIISSLLTALAEYTGWERIADPLPYCEAIHDLPSLKSSLWLLPLRYSNRQQAFRSLLKHAQFI